jgi:hypothetical protein
MEATPTITRIGSVMVETGDLAIANRIAWIAAGTLQRHGYVRTNDTTIRWASAWYWHEHGFAAPEQPA